MKSFASPMRNTVTEMEAHTMDVSSTDEDVHKKDLIKGDKYLCSSCKYESSRHFNVKRHERRIHYVQRPRQCCGITHLTKGEYYMHCEKIHPGKRVHCLVSRLKYKMICDYESEKPPVCTQTIKRSGFFKYTMRSRCSKRICSKTAERSETNIRFRYSINYNEFHLENIPLIYFLTENGLKRYLKKEGKSVPDNDESKINNLDSAIEFNDAQCEQSGKVEQRESNNKCTSMSEFQTERSESPVPCILPVKKLILRRFSATTNIKFESVVIKQENSATGGRILMENRINKSEKISTALISGKNNQTSRTFLNPWLDKENQPTLSKETERTVKLQLDKHIVSPMVTKLHREYLGSIDFDSYKIF